MDKLNRLYKLHRLFRSKRHPVPLARIREELGCSERTARRVIAELRDVLRAPIEYERERNGFYYAGPERDNFELPGLWFSADELYALLTSHQLLDALQPGLFAPYIAPIRDRLKTLLAHRDAGHANFGRRIRLLQLAARPSDLGVFRTLATAVLARKRLRLLYHGRARDAITERTVSPQRLVYYRSNWYLDCLVPPAQGLPALLHRPPAPCRDPRPGGARILRREALDATSPAPTVSSPARPPIPPCCASPRPPPAGSRTNSGTRGRKARCCRTAAMNSRCPTANPRNW